MATTTPTLLLALSHRLRSSVAGPGAAMRAARALHSSAATGDGADGSGGDASTPSTSAPRRPGRPAGGGGGGPAPRRGRPPGSGRGPQAGGRRDRQAASGGGDRSGSRGRPFAPRFQSDGGSRAPPAPLDEFGDPMPLPVINAAGEGAPGWQLLAEDPAIAAAWWAYDATGGRAPGGETAALLSEDAKDAMAAMAAAGASAATLARAFGVRRQRVLAILALKQREAEAAEAAPGKPLPGEAVHFLFNGGVDTGGVTRAALAAVADRRARLDAARAGEKVEEGEQAAAAAGEGDEDGAPAAPAADAAEAAVAAAATAAASALAPGTADFVHGVWHADRLTGPGERHVVALPRYPRFQVLPPTEVEGSGSGAGAGASGTTTDEARPAESDLPAAEAAAAAVQEARAVAEFEARLAYAQGDGDAAGLVTRGSTAGQAAPRRPPGGWGLVVTPLDGGGAGAVGRRGKAAGAPARGSLAPYVALPDGTVRTPTPAERLHLARRVPRARKRIA